MADRLGETLRRGQAALLLCETQEGVLGGSAPWPALAKAAAKIDLVANIIRLADCARSHGAPVVHCTAAFLTGRFGANANARLFANARKRASGDAAHFAEPIAGTFAEGDILLPRYHGMSPMTGSQLDPLLRNAGIDSVVIAGVSINFAILGLTMDAVNRAYQVILPRDATAGFPDGYAEQVFANTLSMLATVASTADIVAAWDGASGPIGPDGDR